MNKDKQNIEDIFKETFENYEVDPGKNAWDAIQSNIGTNAATSAGGSAAAGGSATATSATVGGSWIASTIVAVAISAAVVGGYFIFDQSAEKVKQDKLSKKSTEISISKKKLQKETNEPKNIVKETTADKPISVEEKGSKNQIKNTNQAETKTKQEETSTQTTDGVVKQNTDTTKTNTSTNNQSKEKKVNAEANGKNPVEKVNANSSASNSSKNQNNSLDGKGNDMVNSNPERNTNKSDADVKESTPIEEKTDAPSEHVIEPEIYIPNVFSPNGDGTNDSWIIKIDRFDEVNIKVFNKRSEIIFSSRDLNHNWAGKLLNGKAAAEGLYFYKIVVKYQGKAYKKAGNLSLKR